MSITENNYQEFAIKVSAMRREQKDYFKTRSQKALMDAKKFEWEVDKMLGETTPISAQANLFGKEIASVPPNHLTT